MLRLLPLTLLLASTSWAQTFTVIGIADGDTVTVLTAEKQQIKCRLHGIDAPERHQAFGEASKQSLSNLTYRRVVDVEIVDQDRYGRSVCRLLVGGIDVSREQIARGMAWMYRRYTNDSRYHQSEADAKAKRIGLWSDPNPVPPWDFRKSNR